MENPKIKPITGQKLTTFSNAETMYSFVNEYVDKVYKTQIDDDWSNVIKASKEELTPEFFLREYLWCVYVSGFSARRVANMLPGLLDAHNILIEGRFEYPGVFNIYVDLSKVYKINGNKQKAKAIQTTRKLMADNTWVEFRKTYLKDRDPANIRKLPMMGPATGNHLARNLGNVDIAKPDVHLIRIADKYKFDNVESMCRSISNDPIGLTDLKLWYAAIDNGT